MVREYWDRLSLVMKVTFSVCAWIFVFVLVHGSFTYRANHQKAFAQSVAKRIGIPSIKVSAKSDVLIFEGTATREQSDYAEKIGQYYIMKYGPRSVNPPTEIRNSLQIREPQQPVRQMKQVYYRPVRSLPAPKQSFAATVRRVAKAKPRVVSVARNADHFPVSYFSRKKYKYSDVISQVALKKRVLAGVPRSSALQRR
ncbi:MAG: hypothetical protein EOP05_09700 [Proteobacteria bacterium]|nr:MAG: hypothetical protein EOP05_09700 [Pseudomonadota bacterium]